MRFARFAIAVAGLCSCVSMAPRLAPPVTYPATMEVDFTEIPPERCSPVLDGLFVSHDGATDLVRGMRRAERDCAVRVLEADRDMHIAQFERDALKREIEQQDSNRSWALVGKLGVAGIVIGSIVAGVAIIYQAVRK